MRKVFFLIFIPLFFLAVSCEKDDLTLPVQVDFEFTMDSFRSEGAKKSSSIFEIDEGALSVQQIDFDGRRDQGVDYYFISSFDSLVKAQLHNMYMNQNVSFDVPQGVYNRIDLNLSIGDGNEDALCLKGRFQRGPVEDVAIVFKYQFQEQITIRAKNKLGSDQVVLTQGDSIKATVALNVPYLFQLVNMSLIQEAEITEVDGENVIEINNVKNIDIFNLLATRLDNSMRVTID